jgi:uncharacterized protein
MRNTVMSSPASPAATGLVLAGLVVLSGCAAGPPPNLYVLDLPEIARLAGIERGLTVGVGPVEMPQYLDRTQIVTRATANRLETSENHQWAEPLRNSVSRVLVVTLARDLDSNRVYLVPRRIRTALDYRVEVDIGRLDGALGEAVVLGARWSIFEGESTEALRTQVSLIEEPAHGAGYADLVGAKTRAVQRLGAEIAAAIVAP